jgi:hypothetical protein
VVSATAILSRTEADDPGFANWAQQLGVAHSREFKGGITLGVSPSLTWISSHAEIAAFGVRHLDKLGIL